jgi:hypothetical protein
VKVFISKAGGGVLLVRVRAEGPGGVLGDLTEEVRPGGSFLGHAYDELAALTQGGHDLDPAPGWRPGEIS